MQASEITEQVEQATGRCASLLVEPLVFDRIAPAVFGRTRTISVVRAQDQDKTVEGVRSLPEIESIRVSPSPISIPRCREKFRMRTGESASRQK